MDQQAAAPSLEELHWAWITAAKRRDQQQDLDNRLARSLLGGLLAGELDIEDVRADRAIHQEVLEVHVRAEADAKAAYLAAKGGAA